MKTYIYLLPSVLTFLMVLTVSQLAKAQSSLEGVWQSGNYSITFQQGIYTEITHNQVTSTGLYQFDGSHLLLQTHYGQQTYFPAQCDGNSLAILVNNQWVLLNALRVNPSDNYYSSSSAPLYSGSNDYIAKMTQDVVKNAIRVANGGMTKEEKEAAMDNLPIDTKAVMGMTQSIYSMHELMDRASRGDYQAQKELEKKMQWLEYMAGTLQAWTASGQISNGVRKHQLALNWKNAAQHDRDMGRYFVKEGDMNRARFHAERANDFKQGTEELLVHP